MTEAWNPVTIASIVEGDGEVRALPKLLHRIAAELGVGGLMTPTPMRVPRGKLTCPGGIERAVAALAIRVIGAGGVLVVLDADDDCPAELGPQLLLRARKARPDQRIAVVLANHEFEAWDGHTRKPSTRQRSHPRSTYRWPARTHPPSARSTAKWPPYCVTSAQAELCRASLTAGLSQQQV
jgi:hypothetical protein